MQNQMQHCNCDLFNVMLWLKTKEPTNRQTDSTRSPVDAHRVELGSCVNTCECSAPWESQCGDISPSLCVDYTHWAGNQEVLHTREVCGLGVGAPSWFPAHLAVGQAPGSRLRRAWGASKAGKQCRRRPLFSCLSLFLSALTKITVTI